MTGSIRLESADGDAHKSAVDALKRAGYFVMNSRSEPHGGSRQYSATLVSSAAGRQSACPKCAEPRNHCQCHEVPLIRQDTENR